MTTCLLIARRSAPILPQEQGEVPRREFKILRIHGAQDLVDRHTLVETRDQPIEERLATDGIEERDLVLHEARW